MYSKLTPIRPMALNPTGESFADPKGWTDECTSGTGPVSVEVTMDYDTMESSVAYFAVYLTASTEYTFYGTGTYSNARIDVYNSAGTKVAYNQGNMTDPDWEWVVSDCVYTPSESGVYVFAVLDGSEMGDMGDTYSVYVTPRPSDYSMLGPTPYGTSDGVDALGRIRRYRSAIDGGVLSPFPQRGSWLMLHFENGLADSSPYSRTNLTTSAEITNDGKFGKGLWSDSQITYIPYTENPFYDDFTIQCWVKIANTGRMAVMALDTDQYIGIDNYAGTWNMWAGDGTWGNILQADNDDNDPTGNSGRGTIEHQPGVWTHLAYVHYGNEWILFVNGQESRRKTRTGKITYTDKSIVLGCWGGEVFKANLVMDEFRIDKKALWTSTFTPPLGPYR